MNLAIRAAVFCTLLLVSLSAFLLHTSAQKEDVVVKLLNLPAPPPPNPLVPKQTQRATDFYNKSKNPKDDADINDLYDYWFSMSSSYSAATYSPEPSDAVVARLKKLIEKDPKKLPDLLNAFRKDKDGYEFVKDIYDAQGEGGVFDKDARATIKTWLTYNSPYFSDDLAAIAAGVQDADSYVTNQAELLALARFDFNKAKPIIDRLMLDMNSPASRALAKWALYRHAVDTDSLGDTERYRDELKDIVADKTAADGVRDLAMDALVHEKEFSGRDDWYVSMMADETLVKMQRFTGLTTLINVSPDEKYIDRMIELLKSNDPNVRGAAIRNLTLKLDTGNVELVRALLPWLENPRWAVDNGGVRETLVRKLSEIKMPEAVPALIQLIDEKGKVRVFGPAVNAAVNSNIANRAVTPTETEVESTVLRSAAIQALAFQKDGRAAGRLRRLLNETINYERTMVVSAVLACNGFTIGEQMDALEQAATGVRGEMDDEEAMAAATAANLDANSVVRTKAVGVEIDYSSNKPQPLTPGLLKTLIAAELMSSKEISDALASALVRRLIAESR
ncbi:MAG TPA: HEAT repeat domain-containing protein [Pyrinomonadaceae bacterium]|nr:HEAT repeat domain-containing protein [Pyrinomonadaceae bacterium]